MTATTTLPLKKATILAILFFLILILAYPVWAEDASSTPTQSGSTGTIRKNTLQQKIETRKDIGDKMADFKTKMASREAALKAKLNAFRDQRKAEIAQRVNTNLNRINQNHTDHMLKFLARATEILNKLEARVNQATPDVKDPAAAKAAIADARAKIASAEAAVKLQAQNDYTIQVTSETMVKKDAQAMRQKLYSDLLAVRKVVIDAKQAVSNAIRTAKSGRIETTKEATVSGQ